MHKSFHCASFIKLRRPDLVVPEAIRRFENGAKFCHRHRFVRHERAQDCFARTPKLAACHIVESHSWYACVLCKQEILSGSLHCRAEFRCARILEDRKGLEPLSIAALSVVVLAFWKTEKTCGLSVSVCSLLVTAKKIRWLTELVCPRLLKAKIILWLTALASPECRKDL